VIYGKAEGVLLALRTSVFAFVIAWGNLLAAHVGSYTNVLAAGVSPATSSGGMPSAVGVAHMMAVTGVAQKSAAASQGPMTYHNGPVLRTHKTFAIYWLPQHFFMSHQYQSLINGYMQNVAAASSGNTTVYASAKQYYDDGVQASGATDYGPTGYIQNNSSFQGSYIDTNNFPATGRCNPYSAGNVQITPCLTSAQIEVEIRSVIQSKLAFVPNASTVFFLFLPLQVGSCYSQSPSVCAFSDFCGYHSTMHVSSDPNSLIAPYALIPYAATVSGCTSGQSPNNDDADASINVVSHEEMEAVTDPQVSLGWTENTTDSQGHPSLSEIADKCVNSYPSTPLGGKKGREYDQVIGTGKYYIQEEWSNASMSCVMTYTPTAPSPPTITAPLSTSFGPVAGGTSVTITGTAFIGAGSVSFGPTPATSFTVDSPTQITAVSPAGTPSTVDIRVNTPSGTSAISSNDQFTWQSDMWTTGAALPTARDFTQAVTKGALTYTIGGCETWWCYSPSNANEAYDPVTDTWIPKAPMPTPRGAMGLVLGTNGLIYAIGGFGLNDAEMATNEAYDPATDTWATEAPMPSARNQLAAATGSNGLVYTFGGDHGVLNGGSNLVEAYNPSTNTWICSTGDTSPGCTANTLAPIPEISHAGAAVTVGHTIYLLIGGNGSGPGSNDSDVYAYDVGTNTWTQKASLLIEGDGVGATLGTDGLIYAIGGWIGS
jgi:IPT/TIG domain/Kelch motif